MADDDDDVIDMPDPDAYEDHVSSRAMALVSVGRFAIESKDDEQVRGLALTMMRKLNASIKAPSDAEVRSIQGGKA